MLLLCYGVGSSQGETDPNTDIENDLIVFDFMYSCLAEYSKNVVVSLSQNNEEEKHQISEECKLYPKLKNCLQPKSESTYVTEFIAALDESMKFCNCWNEEILSRMTRLEDVDYCRLCEEQSICLQPYSSNPFIEGILSGVQIAVKSNRCIKAMEEEKKRKEERQKKKKDAIDSGHSEGPVETESPTLSLDNIAVKCDDRNHQTSMNLQCAIWLHNNYHHINPGWKHCSEFTGSYNKPCGLYWAKCKNSGKTHNKNCCISIHCYATKGR